jgi:hypothetical protein
MGSMTSAGVYAPQQLLAILAYTKSRMSEARSNPLAEAREG